MARFLTSLLILLAVWEGLIVALQIKPFLLPRPWLVLQTLITDAPLFLHASRYTLSNMLAGGSLGISLGVLTGFLLAYVAVLRWIAEPYLVLFQSFPRESLLPLMVVWLGFGAAPKIVNAAMLSFFPTAVIVLQALTDTRRDYLQLLESFGANRFQSYLWCRLPNAVPSILGALRIGLPLSLIGAVLGEFMGGGEGLGHLILTSGSAFRVDRIFGAIAILAVTGVLMLSGVTLCERTFCRRFFQL